MKEKPLISIIIPVYNTEFKLLKRCLNSIINQKVSFVEIIIVNDGSTTKVKKFLFNYKRKCKFIRIVDSKKNCGTSISKNKGLKKAKGDYINFVDSDDCIYKNTLKKIKHNIIKENFPDMIIAKYNTNLSEMRGEKKFKDGSFTYKNYDKKYIFNNKINFTYKIDCLWRYFIRRKLVIKNNISFEPTAYKNEDKEFMVKTFLSAKSFFFVNLIYYYYFLHNKNLSWTDRYSFYKVCLGNYNCIKNIIFFLKENKINDEKKLEFAFIFLNDLVLMLNLNILNLDFNQVKIFQNKINKQRKIFNFYHKYFFFEFLKASLKENIDRINNIFLSKLYFLDQERKRKIYVYGASEYALPLLKVLRKKHYPILGFLDSNFYRFDKKTYKLKIFSTKDMLIKLKKYKNDMIIIVCHPHIQTCKRIERRLIRLGVNKKNMIRLDENILGLFSSFTKISSNYKFLR